MPRHIHLRTSSNIGAFFAIPRRDVVSEQLREFASQRGTCSDRTNLDHALSATSPHFAVPRVLLSASGIHACKPRSAPGALSTGLAPSGTVVERASTPPTLSLGHWLSIIVFNASVRNRARHQRRRPRNWAISCGQAAIPWLTMHNHLEAQQSKTFQYLRPCAANMLPNSHANETLARLCLGSHALDDPC